ncbi:unnamed protein product [Cuscuta campestris]|uniref:UBC core domain-containing protein n=1 Tax=Cuscuta campestris TaxID=132261 RepID=A0A484NBK2_9ASTE|nr:unnamed protein product [Cuscuta campestris]
MISCYCIFIECSLLSLNYCLKVVCSSWNCFSLKSTQWLLQRFDFSQKSTTLILISIQALLSAPNPDDPLSENIAKHWKTNEAEAVETAKEWSRLYASGA